MRLIALTAALTCGSFAAWAGEATPAATPAAEPAQAAPPSIEELFRSPRYRTYSLSPDGRFMIEIFEAEPVKPPANRANVAEWLAYLSSPLQEIWLTDLETNQYQKVSAGVRGVRARGVRWLDARTFLWHVYTRGEWAAERLTIKINEDGSSEIGDVTHLGPSYVIGKVAGGPLRVLVSGDDRGRSSVFRVDPLQPFKAQLTPENRIAGPFLGLVDGRLDGADRVRTVSLARRFDEQRVLYRESDAAPWRAVYTVKVQPWQDFKLVGFDDARNVLQVITNIGTDKLVLRELDPATGQLGSILYSDPRNDVTDSAWVGADGRVQAVEIADNALRIEYLDPAIAKLARDVAKLMPGYLPRIHTLAENGSRAVVFTGDSDNPGKYSLYDPAKNTLLLMEHAAPWHKGRKLARSEPISFKSRDGLALYGSFTPPQPPVDKPPLVVLPHGGPFGIRDVDFYNPEVQFLASRGYAVLQVNFRGSGGFGRDFLKAGFGRWGREMHDDVVDGVRWIMASGRVDAARACIYGASYGGYAAMMGVLQEPELFRCGVTLAGVSDLNLQHSSEDFRDDPVIKGMLKEIIGDPAKEKETLQKYSPVFLARDLKRPVLIAHGGKDTRVDPEHAWRLRAAIEAAGGKPEWLFFADEGHGFAAPENRETFYSKLEKFLAEHLGR